MPQTISPLIVLNRSEVRQYLTMKTCIPLMREAAMALSRGDVSLLLRTVLPLPANRKFGIMILRCQAAERFSRQFSPRAAISSRSGDVIRF